MSASPTYLRVPSAVPITGMQLTAAGIDSAQDPQPCEESVDPPLDQTPVTSDAAAAPDAESLSGELLETIANVLQEMDRRRENNLREMQEACLELAVAIAARLVWTEIDGDRLAVAQLVEAAIERMRGQGAVSIFLNPLDVAVWEHQTSTSGCTIAENTRIVGDPQVPRGDCRAVCDEFSLIRDIELELREMHEQLLQGIEDVAVERRKDVRPNQNLNGFRTAAGIRSASGIVTAKIPATTGELCEVRIGDELISYGEVIAVHEEVSQILLFDDRAGLGSDGVVVGLGHRQRIPTGQGLLGRAITVWGPRLTEKVRCGCASAATSMMNHRRQSAAQTSTCRLLRDNALSMDC